MALFSYPNHSSHFSYICMHYLLHSLVIISKLCLFIQKKKNFQVVVQFTGMSDQDHENGLPENPTWPELKLPDLLFTNAVREVHAAIENEWDPLQRSACQTAAGRALWKHLIHDPLADLLAGETYLTSLYEKIKKDRISNAREVSGVILAVRTLWFDSKIEALLNSFTMKEAQVVFLGAGL